MVISTAGSFPTIRMLGTSEILRVSGEVPGDQIKAIKNMKLLRGFSSVGKHFGAPPA